MLISYELRQNTRCFNNLLAIHGRNIGTGKKVSINDYIELIKKYFPFEREDCLKTHIRQFRNNYLLFGKMFTPTFISCEIHPKFFKKVLYYYDIKKSKYIPYMVKKMDFSEAYYEGYIEFDLWNFCILEHHLCYCGYDSPMYAEQNNSCTIVDMFSISEGCPLVACLN